MISCLNIWTIEVNHIMRVINRKLYDGAVTMRISYGKYTSHYCLNARRFHDRQEILDAMLKYNSACTLPNSNQVSCDLQCTTCEHSIYYLIGKKQHAFNLECQKYADATPQAGDEWELSVVLNESVESERYVEYYVLADDAVSDRIVDIINTYVLAYIPIRIVEAIYLKVRCGNMNQPLDITHTVYEQFHFMND